MCARVQVEFRLENLRALVQECDQMRMAGSTRLALAKDRSGPVCMCVRCQELCVCVVCVLAKERYKVLG